MMPAKTKYTTTENVFSVVSRMELSQQSDRAWVDIGNKWCPLSCIGSQVAQCLLAELLQPNNMAATQLDYVISWPSGSNTFTLTRAFCKPCHLPLSSLKVKITL